MKKRLLSLAMATVMIFGMIPAFTITTDAATYASRDLTYVPPNEVPDYCAPVFNTGLVNLMEDYIKGANYTKMFTGEQSDNGNLYSHAEWTTGSIGSMFYSQDEDDRTKGMRYYYQFAGNNLIDALSPDSTYISCNNLEFKFDTIRSTPQVAYWLDDLDLTHLYVNIGATMLSDESSLTYNGQTISGKGAREMTVKFDPDASIYLNGDVSYPYVVLLDDTAPTIVDAYIENISTNIYEDKMRLTIEMNEALRIINNFIDPDYNNTYDIYAEGDAYLNWTSPAPFLTLTVEYGDVGAGVATGTFDVTLDEIDGKYMYFKLPDGANEYGEDSSLVDEISELGEFSIMKISDAKWTYIAENGTVYDNMDTSYGFTLWGIYNNRMEGDLLLFTDTENAPYYMAGAAIAEYEPGQAYFDIWSPYTDYAGNSFDISGQSLVAYDVIYDKTPPTVSGISLSGNMITADSTSAGDKTSWDEDIDLSALYAGYGDQIAISVQFDEDITIVEPITMTFNFFEKETVGTSITYSMPEVTAYLSSSDTLTSTNRWDSEESALNGLLYDISYEAYSIEETPIRVYSMTGVVQDKAGNQLDLSDIQSIYTLQDTDDDTVYWTKFTPAQQIYLDGTAPSVDVTEIDSNPVGDSIVSYQFDFSDDQYLYNGIDEFHDKYEGSTAVGKTLTLGLNTSSSYTSPSAVPFNYYWTDDAAYEPDDTTTWTESTTYSSSTATTKFSLPIIKDTMYLYVQFPQENEAYVPGFYFSGYITDWAGNGTSVWNSTPARTYIDTMNPVLSINSVKQSYNTGENSTVETIDFTVNATAYDEGHSSISYLDNVTVSGGDDSDTLVYQNYYNTTTYFANQEYTITVPVSAIDNNSQVELTITATDSNGNTTTIERTETVNTASFTADYTVGGDYSAPTEAPSVVVSGSSEGDTRVTVVTDDGTYVRVIGSTETDLELFTFDSAWYKVTMDGNDTYTSAVHMEDRSELTNYYGPMTFTFDTNADSTVSLTPVAGDSVVPSGTSNHWTGTSFTINYAPVVESEAVHSVTFTGMNNADGTAASNSAGYYSIDQTLEGATVTFTLANVLCPSYGVSNIDFTQSYAQLLDSTGAVVATMALVESETQTIALPKYGVDDALLDTGVYQVQVIIVQKGVATTVATDDETYTTYTAGNTVTTAMDDSIVYDNIQPTGGGVWSYSTTLSKFYPTGSTLLDESIQQVQAASGNPYTSLVLNLKDSNSSATESIWTEAYRDGQLAMFYGGADIAYLRLGIEESLQTLSVGGDSVTIGDVAAYRIWNTASTTYNSDTVDWTSGTFFTLDADGDGTSQRVINLTLRVNNTYTGDSQYSVVNTADELNTSAKNLLLQGATNTLYYQFKMDNGSLSPIYELTVVMTDETPQISVVMENPDYVNDNSISTTSANSIYSIDITPYTLFSASGDVTLYKLLRSTSNSVTEITSGETENISYNDLNSLTSYTTGVPRLTYLSNTRLGYLAMDAYGGVTLVTPEFNSSSYGTDSSYSADYYFNAYVVSDVNNALSLYQTYNNTSDKFNTYWIGSGLNGSYLDLENSTVQFGDAAGNGELLPLSGDITPNAFGYMGAYVSGSTVLFEMANPYEGQRMATTATFTFAFTHGQEPLTVTVSVEANNYESTKTLAYAYDNTKGTGVITNLVGSLDGKSVSSDLTFPIYEKANATYTYYDATGTERTVELDTSDFIAFDYMPEVSYSTTDPTTGSVTVTFTAADGGERNAIWDSANNDYYSDVVTVSENTVLTYLTTESGYYRYQFPITNIVSTSPTELWLYTTNLTQDTEDGTYVIDSIADQATVMLYDDTWTLVDEIGDSLSYTFPLGSLAGEEYTFYYRVAELPTMDLLEYTVELPYDVKETTVTLADYEVIAPTVDDQGNEVDDTDSDAPSIQLLAYGLIGGTAFVNSYKLYKQEVTGTVNIFEGYEGYDPYYVTATVNPALTDYSSDYTTYSSSTEFISALGWGSYYRFQVETKDNSNVKLIVKSSPTITPTYDMVSDEIDGVSLTSTTLDVSANTSFYLYAVDSENNYTVVPMTFTSVGEAPVPQMVKEVVGDAVRVYLVPADGDTFEDLTITTTGYTTGTGTGDYIGCPYIEFTANGNYTITYSHTYLETTTTGSLYAYINEIDTSAPVLINTTWSASKTYEATNQNVTATLIFNETIASTQASTTIANDAVQVMISGSTVSVRYYENYGAFTLYFYDASGNGMSVEMDAVTNIDRVFEEPTPTITVDGTTATITFTFGETAICGKTGTSGTTLSYNVTANGDYTYTFYDVAGNSVTTSVTVNEDNLKPLELSYSLNGTTAVAVEDLTLSVTDTSTIYVMANRDCNVYFNGKTAVDLSANTWSPLTISIGDCATTPFIYAADSLGYTVSASLSGITANDSTAPVVSLVSSELNVSMGDSEATILALLRENLVASDNVTATSYLKTNATITYTKPSTAGTVIATYTVKDEAGNTAAAITCNLTFTAEPAITINGTTVTSDSTTIVSASDVNTLYIYFDGEPFSLMYEAGLKTVSQVKIGSTDLIYNASDAQSITILEGASTGYYTFCAVTQSREYFRFIVYVR